MEKSKINISTVASDRALHRVRTSLFTFIRTNKWFTGTIYLISHPVAPLSKRSIDLLKQIYSRISVIDLRNYPELSSLLQRNRSNAFEVDRLLTFGIFALPQETVYFSNAAVFINPIDDLVNSEKSVISENTLDFIYLKENPKELVSSITTTVNIREIFKDATVCDDHLFKSSVNYSDSKYHLFMNDSKVMNAIIFNTFENSQKYQKINSYWSNRNLEVTNHVRKPVKNTPRFRATNTKTTRQKNLMRAYNTQNTLQTAQIADYFDFINNKKIIIVGPSPNILEKGYGEYIDSFDVVIRTNGGFPVNPELQNDYGSRCDVIYINSHFTSFHLLERIEDYIKNDVKFVLYKDNKRLKTQEIQSLENLKLSFIRWENHYSNILTGIYIIFNLIQLKVKEITITGMDFYETQDSDGAYIPGYRPDTIKSERYGKYSVNHDIEFNKNEFNKFSKQIKINFLQ